MSKEKSSEKLKEESLERLINKWMNATGQEEKMLLAIIRRIKPGFKGKK
jgi:hypothetical protein